MAVAQDLLRVVSHLKAWVGTGHPFPGRVTHMAGKLVPAAGLGPPFLHASPPRGSLSVLVAWRLASPRAGLSGRTESGSVSVTAVSLEPGLMLMPGPEPSVKV